MLTKWEILICQIEGYLVETKKGEIMIIKHTTLTASLVLALALQAATVQPLAASDSRFEKVTNESDLLDVLVGKTLTSRDYIFTLNADYSLEGSYEGRPIRGKWMFILNDAICFDFQTSVHCGTPMVNSGDVTSVRFERSAKVRNRLYFSNPYPNLLDQYSVSQ